MILIHLLFLLWYVICTNRSVQSSPASVKQVLTIYINHSRIRFLELTSTGVYEESWPWPVWGSNPRSRGGKADTLAIRPPLPLNFYIYIYLLFLSDLWYERVFFIFMHRNVWMYFVNGNNDFALYMLSLVYMSWFLFSFCVILSFISCCYIAMYVHYAK